MNKYFLIFEILMISLFVLCLLHARKQNLLMVMKLFAGLIFGLLLEWATIQQLSAYSYGTFPIMVGEVPVSIGIGWSVIIYSAGLFSDATNLKLWKRPILDALVALNIDLAMDTIAIRLGMWDWGIGYNECFFGVPWGNFWAWFWVVLFFSAGFRYFKKHQSAYVRSVAPLGGIVIGTAGVLATNYFIVTIVPRSVHFIVIPAILIFAMGFILFQRSVLLNKELSLPVVVVPLIFHIYFIIAGVISGVIFQPIYLLIISFIMVFLSLIMHRHFFVKKIKRDTC